MKWWSQKLGGNDDGETNGEHGPQKNPENNKPISTTTSTNTGTTTCKTTSTTTNTTKIPVAPHTATNISRIRSMPIGMMKIALKALIYSVWLLSKRIFLNLRVFVWDWLV